MKIFSGSSNQALAEKIAKELQVNLGRIDLSAFPNGEDRVWVKEDVIGEACVVVQSFSFPPDKMIIEFLLIVDALVRAGARKIMAVIPWFGYSLQDKVFRTGEPIAAKMMAKMISLSSVSRIFTVDLHSESVAAFFDVPVMHCSAKELFLNYLKKTVKEKNLVVVSPDFGAMKKSRHFARELNLHQVVINKERDHQSGQLTIHGISAPVKAKICLIFDDLINTGRTIAQTAAYLKKQGAGQIYFFATHNLYLKEGYEALEKSAVAQVIVTDSVYNPGQKLWKKLKIISLAPLLASGIKKWL